MARPKKTYSRKDLLASSIAQLEAIIADPDTPPSVRVQAIQQKMKAAELLPQEKEDEFAAFRDND